MFHINELAVNDSVGLRALEFNHALLEIVHDEGARLVHVSYDHCLTGARGQIPQHLVCVCVCVGMYVQARGNKRHTCIMGSSFVVVRCFFSVSTSATFFRLFL